MPDISESESITDLQFLRNLEKSGNLISIISAEFSGDGDQITYVPANGKTFFLISAKLYPVVDSIITGGQTAINTRNRRADVELTYNSVVKDVLTHDMETTYGSNTSLSDFSQGNAGQAGQYVTTAKGISLVGDGAKAVKLTSTNTSGTYRVALLGWIEDT